MRHLILLSLLLSSLLRASDAYPPPRFTDRQRVEKLESVMPELDVLFRRYATDKKIPGMVWGVVIDGKLAHVASYGVQDVASYGVQDVTSKTPVSADTAFRIASMTKSFTVLAILKLRDEGKLSLDDPISKWIPEFAAMELPTRDSAPLRIRNILSHSAGFPEDNPWGDQQLSASDADMTQWLRRGIPFSTPPDTRYEYSNYAFGLLGRVVTNASGVPYQKYVTTEILAKLHMDSSTLVFADVPLSRRAIGYRLQPDGTYLEEPPLPQGAFGSAGGILTTAKDMGKYLAFHLSAWPARDDAEAGPVNRSSVREMSHLWTPSNLTVTHTGGTLRAAETGYGYGLRVTSDCRFERIAGHGGGLPGFGSYMAWLPDYGVGMFAMASLTYSGPAEPINQAWDVLLKTGGLQARELPASPILTEMRQHIFNLWNKWDESEAKQMASMNLYLDAPVAQRRAEMQKIKDEVGDCTAATPVVPQNWLRGQFNLSCSKGWVGVFFTLAPTQPPTVQQLTFRKLDSVRMRMDSPTGPAARNSCVE